MKTASIIVCTACFLCMASSPALAVKGEWLTDADQALAAAARSKNPILAVAMDHG